MGWISAKEAHARLSGAVALSTVYRLVHDGELLATTIGGKILISAESLDALVAKGSLAVLRAPRQRQPKGRKPKRAA